ncbi:histone-lysine N-methyltransferase SETMAR [Plakobranchus ocellatus]|uniref:Histone-lysine N-methyltransferase SETMAR n=1 Tax=Plakobranchus ocellatus TaxID=259542 RepID=A0AAV3Y4R7_9GAST|nr:histone-lysine N-methyltransferase SETMAR [Plakobranchus ocellatus]
MKTFNNSVILRMIRRGDEVRSRVLQYRDAKGVILLDILPQGQCINAAQYCSTLDRLKEVIRRKRPGLLRRGVVLQQDDATPHSANLTQQWLQRYSWEILPHPAHSPDLAPSDFHLFGPLKRHLEISVKDVTELNLTNSLLFMPCQDYYIAETLEFQKRLRAFGNGGVDPYYASEDLHDWKVALYGDRAAHRQGYGFQKPKIPPLSDPSQVDLYLERFERHAAAFGWHESEWASCLANLLQDEALSVILSLSPTESADYQSVKRVLLRRFNCDRNGFKSKFLLVKPQAGEDFGTFINRAKRYLDRWIELSAVSTLEGLCYLICSEIAFQACDEDFVAYVKDRSPSDMVSLKAVASAYIDARPNSSGGSGVAASRIDVTCYQCGGKGHVRRECPSRPKEAKSPCSVPKLPSHCSAAKNGYDRRGKLKIESCKVFDRVSTLLRDSGCNTVGVCKSLVPPDCYTGKSMLVNTFCCKNKLFSTCIVNIQTPYFSGDVEAC